MKTAMLIFGLVATGLVIAQPVEAPKPEVPAYSVAEPKKPARAKASVRKRAARHNAQVRKAQRAPKPAPAVVAKAELPKPNGPCIIKPVMSDQDLVNCGATPHDR